MGGAVSAGNDNDELVENLVAGEYIKSPLLEKVFRAVDRGDYYLQGCKENAYRDLAWKHGHIHLSAPCIYSEVMEALDLAPGMSFLNLGSGTGYLSTMAGLVLGPYGTNHGVELHKDVVEYANEKLDEFMRLSGAVDKFEFCPPTFVVGNCLLLDSSVPLYDRVYCGASCPPEHEMYMKNRIRIGGILVMPINDHLMRITRTSSTTFDGRSVLPVSFAPLVEPSGMELRVLPTVKLPEIQPQLFSLQETCRFILRAYLRRIIELENPIVNAQKKIVSRRSKWLKKEIMLRNGVLRGNPPGDGQSNDGTGSSFESTVYQPPPTTSRFIVDFRDVKPIKRLARCLDSSAVVLKSITKTDTECIEKKESSPETTITVDDEDKGQSGNGDSGIDNISDESVPEECPSDVEMEEMGSPNSAARTRKVLLKRSAEDDEDDDKDDADRPNRRSSGREGSRVCRSSNLIFKRVAFNDNDSEDLDELESDDSGPSEDSGPSDDSGPSSDSGPSCECGTFNCNHTLSARNLSIYYTSMRQKINELPLPVVVKRFLMHSRPIQ